MGNWEMKIEERKFFYLGNEIRIQIYFFYCCSPKRKILKG